MAQEHLTLEYLAPYLPHKLMFQYSNRELPPEEMDAKAIEMLVQQHTVWQKVIHNPLLHPLSRLMDEIETGEGKLFPVNYWEEHLDCVKIEDELVNMATNNYCDFHLPYHVMQKLFEWHIDVFGLIPKGLAEAIKT